MLGRSPNNMLLFTDKVKQWLVKEAKSYRKHKNVMGLFCFAARQDQKEHQKLLQLARNAGLSESERTEYIDRAYAIPINFQSFMFMGAGWGLNEIKESKFHCLDLEGERIVVPPELYSFLEGRELVVSEREYELVLKEPASDSEILHVLSGDTGPFLTTALINDGEQDGAEQPATAPDSKPEGNEKPKPESEERSQ